MCLLFVGFLMALQHRKAISAMKIIHFQCGIRFLIKFHITSHQHINSLDFDKLISYFCLWCGHISSHSTSSFIQHKRTSSHFTQPISCCTPSNSVRLVATTFQHHSACPVPMSLSLITSRTLLPCLHVTTLMNISSTFIKDNVVFK
jgi:hypothetical protein